jgi:hypothetical protein
MSIISFLESVSNLEFRFRGEPPEMIESAGVPLSYISFKTLFRGVLAISSMDSEFKWSSLVSAYLGLD